VKVRSIGRLAWSLWALAMVLEGAAIWLWLGNHALGGGYFTPQVFIVPGFTTVGALIVARRGNMVGWLFVGLGLLAALHALAMAYAQRDTLIGPGSLPAGSLAGVLAGGLWPLNYLLFGVILLVFPDGRLPSPRWRPAARFFLVLWGLAIVFNALTPSDENTLSVPALARPPWQLLTLVLSAGTLIALVVAAAAPFVRFRRAAYQQRQQLKWVAFIVAVSVVSVLASLGLSHLFPGVEVLVFLGALGLFGAVVGIPVAVAMAILRHRLYDIDRLINRTLVYGVLTTILGLSYASAVLVLGEVFGGMGAEPPTWAVAGATLAVAAVFRPARRRIQAAVDRRFNRRKYNAAKTIETFSARLRDELDPDALVAEVVAVVDHTMEPSARSLWLRSHTRR
jgi:hypothetical protein